MSLGLSDREAAELVGVSHVAIYKARKNGRIPTLSDGSLGKEEVRDWFENRRTPRGGKPSKVNAKVNAKKRKVNSKVNTEVNTCKVNEKTKFETLLEERHVFLSRREAELYRDSFVARLKELEYHTRLGELVPIENVAKAVGQDYARIRTRLLALPAEQAPTLFQCKTVNDLQDRLHTLVTRVLEELSQDEHQHEQWKSLQRKQEDSPKGP
ncbi:MerR family transcriptional regulator [Entomobacter blattae]|uniref:Uncharacterized protein n=1 Tax=Entomobacter blattae TaxID=2762277 RepID=A0A7H1NUG8_9PROT|nr:helix-turn-helix domain-containing protein [Entomobacter blattae]QNT79428.1 hypothetical protein JGUZn3_22270 [Entomobacter blattae]